MSRDLITLSDVSLGFGAGPLFSGVGLRVTARDRLCLVGRNGSGKSTLLKLLAGEIEPDKGTRTVVPGTRIARLTQEFDAAGARTIVDFVTAGLPADEEALHRVATVLEPLGLDAEHLLTDLSGGEGRRVGLARALVAEPDVLLLDEPTNHLDIAAIEWLERLLDDFRGAVVLISHDRALLERVSSRTAWIDRGRLVMLDAGYAKFDRWVAEMATAEAASASRLDQRLKAESRWLLRGVTARRKRNQGRLRALHGLRAERAALRAHPEMTRPELGAGPRGGDVVIEAKGIGKSFGARVILGDFSIRVMRKDRVAVIGPNGVGKTTLIHLLIGDLAPDTGTVTLGSGLESVLFDQQRRDLDPALTPWELLCPQGGDRVDVRGRSQHVVGYLRDFLFDESQARMPIAHLSGGERARLQLARLLARPANLLVLDEPTNDLDMETLDILEDLLGDYDGTLLLVSHDRAFIDRVATSTIVLDGSGRATEFVGGYSDYRRQVAGGEAPAPRETLKEKRARARPATRPAAARLTYREQRDLESLPERVDRLADELRDLEALLADGGLYARDRARFENATTRHAEAMAEIADAEARWLELEEKSERLEGGA